MPIVIGKWRETTGKYTITLHSCIPVTDKEKINEQKKSIGTGSLYVQTKLGVLVLRHGGRRWAKLKIKKWLVEVSRWECLLVEEGILIKLKRYLLIEKGESTGWSGGVSK